MLSPLLAQTVAQQILTPYMSVFFVAFLVCLVVTPIVRRLALSNGIVDVPDLLRKNHREPIAYLGGVAIFIGWLIGILASNFVDPHTIDTVGGNATVEFPISIVIGGIAIVMTGMLDDIYGISPRLKIGGQLFAAAGLALDDIGHRFVENSFALLGLGFIPDVVVYALGTVLLAFLVVAGCNAVNLIDGLDGLASGVCAIATAGFLVVAVIVASRSLESPLLLDDALRTDPIRIVMCLAVIGAILGFLPYNFNPATIFMGDAGSLLLGFFAVTSILLFADTDGAALKLATVCLIIFAVPITDTSLAILRRKLRGKPIFAPDNEHLHHLLRRSGYSVRQSVGLMYLAGLSFAAMGVVMVAIDLPWLYIMAIFCVIYGFILVTVFKVARNLAARDRGEVALPTPVAERIAGERADGQPHQGQDPGTPHPHGTNGMNGTHGHADLSDPAASHPGPR
jgi:UDP-GlcNAc:undecaprenyl-phosphate GlcNAc-1-phosphate transferase